MTIWTPDTRKTLSQVTALKKSLHDFRNYKSRVAIFPDTGFIILYNRNSSAPARFNITITPTLLLIKKGKEKYMTVTSGVIALSELERKLYRAVRYLQGNTRGDNFLMYDFQKGSAFDPASILDKGRQPWRITE